MKTPTSLLVLALLFGPLFASAASQPESCARTPSEVMSTPAVRTVAAAFGKPSDLFGSWKLAGLPGLIAKVVVTLSATKDSLVVQVDDNRPNDFWFCVSADQPDVLKMRVQDARQPENALILLKAREPGQTVLVASQKSGWKFMKFKRRSDD